MVPALVLDLFQNLKDSPNPIGICTEDENKFIRTCGSTTVSSRLFFASRQLRLGSHVLEGVH